MRGGEVEHGVKGVRGSLGRWETDDDAVKRSTEEMKVIREVG